MSFGDRNEIRLLRNRYENKRASDEEGKVVFDEEISQELEECSEEDIRIVYDMVKALVKSLAKRKH